MTTASVPTVRLIDPTGFDPGAAPLLLASRPVDLRGRRLGLLDNSKAKLRRHPLGRRPHPGRRI